MSNLIGQSVGRYQILEQLGEGGMATVYKAHDTRLDRFVAIKVIRTDQFAPAMLAEMMRRFEREAKALAQLSHPNIVHVHDYGEYEGAPYLVMEYLPSGNLEKRPNVPMPWQEALRILVPIAEALAYAHEHNIIHRDIKPANILLTEKGRPMLSDFGIAKILENKEAGTLTSAGSSIGTPEYMAPEQWVGEAGPQSDIYSLGVVLYELVTGRKPFVADTPISIMLKQANEPLPRPSEYVTDLPVEFENVLLKAMEKQPGDRYKSMSEFAAALETLADRKPLTQEMKETGPLAGKTLLATGEPGQEAELASLAGGNGSKTGAAKPGTPASSTEHRPVTSKRRGWWVPIGVLGLLLCIGVVAAASFLIKGLTGKNLSTSPPITSTPAVPTQLISQTLTSPQAVLPNPTPTSDVKVLWDISHGPRTSGDGSLYTPEGMYSTLAKSLVAERFVISSGDLSNLDSYDILVLSEVSGKTPFTNDEADKIEQFVRKAGHGLLILSDTPDIENLADVVGRRFSIGLGEINSDGPVSYSNEPFFSGILSIQYMNGGGIFLVSPPSQTASVDKNGNAVIAFCKCDAGRVMAVADTNLWDNGGLGQEDNQRFALNVFEWLAKLSP